VCADCVENDRSQSSYDMFRKPTEVLQLEKHLIWHNLHGGKA
jgi:hypothetical protein